MKIGAIAASALALFALAYNSHALASSSEMQPYMKPVDAVLSAMAQHQAKDLDGAYTSDAVIVDDQAPYRWSGSNAPSDWLSTLTTFGKLHYASFRPFAVPMQLMRGPDTAYLTVIGRLQGSGVRRDLKQYATITFSLRKVGADWKITSQSWTDIPPPKL